MKAFFIMLVILWVAFIGNVESHNEETDYENDLEDFLADDIGDEDLSEDDFLDDRRRDPWWSRRIRIRFPRIRIFKSRRRCVNEPLPACKTAQNGCGPKNTESTFGRVNFINKKVFTSSCNKHDNCYDCHTERGWHRNQCDLRFKKDMISRCNCHYNRLHQVLARGVCRAQANIMYAAVALGGRFFIKKTTEAYCYNGCVNRIGNPHIAIDH